MFTLNKQAVQKAVSEKMLRNAKITTIPGYLNIEMTLRERYNLQAKNKNYLEKGKI